MAIQPRIYLVPGFFGFANFGDLKYFGHVRDFLRRAGLGAEVHVVPTRPTGRRRGSSAALMSA